MIDLLDAPRIEESAVGYIQHPTPRELVEKINEIIQYLNDHELMEID